MDLNYILSICQCVIDDLFIHGLHFHYVSDSAVHSDYHDMRNNCRLYSGKLHHYGLLYCLKHLQVLQKFFLMMFVEEPQDFVRTKMELSVKTAIIILNTFIWKTL